MTCGKTINKILAGVMLAAGSQVFAAGTLTMDRDACVKMALENNRMCKVSEFDIQIAEAMLAQAKSAYWPTLSAGLTAGIMDDPLLFTYPASSIDASALAGAPPGSVFVDVPEQKVEVMDDTVIMGSLNLKYPLYTGGIRKAINEQARYGVEAAKQGTRRTELQVVYDVERAYYGAVMTRRLVKISDDTLQRMEATLDLTKRLYEEGSGMVKKTDYLRNKTVVEIIRATKSSMKEKQFKADTALINLMGLDRGTKVEPADAELPACVPVPSAEELIAMALEVNPDLARVRAGIGAASAGVDEARGSYLPKLGLFAKYVHIESDIESGMMDPQNKHFGAIGIGGQLPLFEGFRNKNHVLETRLKLEKLRAQEEALIEGIAVQIDHAYAELESANEREVCTGAGLQAAAENRDLNVRAYQEELVETADVIQAQFMEAFLDANYQKTLYECIEARAKLSFLVGSETEMSADTTM